MNGIDSVVIATGNDFRAVEACAHAYASKNGNYSSLSHARVQKDEFVFWMEIPLAVGTVGGITNLHPLVKWSLKLLKNPSAQTYENYCGCRPCSKFCCLKIFNHIWNSTWAYENAFN